MWDKSCSFVNSFFVRICCGKERAELKGCLCSCHHQSSPTVGGEQMNEIVDVNGWNEILQESGWTLRDGVRSCDVWVGLASLLLHTERSQFEEVWASCWNAFWEVFLGMCNRVETPWADITSLMWPVNQLEEVVGSRGVWTSLSRLPPPWPELR